MKQLAKMALGATLAAAAFVAVAPAQAQVHVGIGIGAPAPRVGYDRHWCFYHPRACHGPVVGPVVGPAPVIGAYVGGRGYWDGHAWYGHRAWRHRGWHYY